MLLFKDIKQNYPVYILDTQEFSLIQGKATQVSFPRLEMNQKTGKTEMVVDVTIEANDPDGYDGMIFCRWTADAIGKSNQVGLGKIRIVC